VCCGRERGEGGFEIEMKGREEEGYKNRSNFLKFGENWCNGDDLNLKTVEILIIVLKFHKKSEKYM
jgi:hypothetical protein